MEASAQEQQIARAATIVSIGQVLSRIVGLAREGVIADVFGASGPVSAYTAASQVPFTLYDMLIGGMVSSALVPTFSAYVASKRKEELWQLASLLFTLATVVLGTVILLLEIGTPVLTWLLVRFDEAALQAETTILLRILLPSVLFLGLSGIATSLCHALQRFALPAFTSMVFNVSIVTAALVFGPLWKNVRVLAVGLVAGAALQVALQLPALRDVRFRPRLNWRHPALRQILRLYLPVILSLIVAAVGVLLDRNLASRTGKESISWMRFATALTQFPLGLISAAIAAAILPTLARQAAREEEFGEGSDLFCDTLARGLGLVLFLTIPATIGLLVLARPIVALLFQHGDFGAADTAQTARALRYYMIGLTFAAVDQPLIFSFYARKDTWRPALVGILGVGFYLAVALPTIRSLGMIGLILANGAQLAGHALVMIWLFQRRIGKLHKRGIEQTLFRSLLAVVAMGIAMWGVVRMAEALVPLEGRALWAATVLAGGATGLMIYLALAALFRVRELETARTLLRQAFSRAGWATRQLSS